MTTKDYIKSTARAFLNDADNSFQQNEITAAIYLAETLFADAVDKAGKPYIGHLARVAGSVPDDRKAAAWLHDLVEDIEGWDYQDLADIGFSDLTIRIIRAVTKHAEGEPYFDAMQRVGEMVEAIPVKRADLRDNANLLRLNRKPDTPDFERVTKYFFADKYLEAIETGFVASGTPFADWMRSQPATLQDDVLLTKETAKKPPSASL